MEEYKQNPPDASEIPFGFTEADGVHDQSWQEKFQADDLTVRTRKKISALMAAFNALWLAASFDRICTDAGIDPGELRRMYMTILELAMRAEEDAERDNYTPSATRSFNVADCAAELCYRREYLGGSTEEEKEKRRRSLARAWRERWKRTIHPAQCRNHLPFVERTPGRIVGKQRKSSSYVERMADVLAMIGRTVDRNRGRVSRYTRAAEAAVAHLRQIAEPYAPDFDYNPESKEPDPLLEEDESGEAPVDDPQYLKTLKRAIRQAKQGSAYATREEIAVRRLELHEWIDALWPDDDPEQKNAHPPSYSPSVLRNVDASKIGTAPPVEVVTKTAFPESEDCEIPAENGDSSEFKGDVNAPLKAQFSGVEYDPEPEPRGQSLSEAEATLDAFVSVGAKEVVAVVVDDALPRGENLISDDHLDVDKFRRALPYYFEHNLENPTHSVCGRPQSKLRLIQVDDCSWEVVCLLLPFAFLVAMTSPGNFQVWIALSDVIPDDEEFKAQKRRLYKKLNPKKDKKGPNGGAHGSIRWPGMLNRKPLRRYADGESPRIQLIGATPGRITSLAELDAAGLLAPLPRKATPEEVRELKTKLPVGGWPDINDYLSRAGDRSGPECGWAMAAFKRGFPRHSIIAKLKEIGPKASTRDDDYAEQTVTAAWNFLTEQVGERVVA
jgi:hypothetical protein